MPHPRLRLILLLACGALGGCGPAPPPAPLPYTQRLDLSGIDTAPLRGRRILIDPGHGGRFAGTVGDAGTREADVNLGVALALWGLLHDASADVRLTRTSDRDLLGPGSGSVRDDLSARVQAIDSLQPEVFLSLHHNSNAARDRERNAIETYFKLDDDGPSLDLGRAIAARLARHLTIQPAHLLPGNYYVLRGAPGAAVLGEASYLSNPRVESQLGLEASQRLEAEAYFLGLVDYFARGAAAIERQFPAGDTLCAGEQLRFGVAEPVDPLTVRLRLDGMPLAAYVESATGAIVASRDLALGPHDVEVRARLARGNAAQPWHGRVWVRGAAARAIVSQDPDPAAVGTVVRLCIAVQDAAGMSVGSGVPVTLGGTQLQVLAAEESTTQGSALVLVRALSPAAVFRVQAGALVTAVPLRTSPQGRAACFARCTDARDGRSVPHAWLGDGEAESDRAGYLPLACDADTIRIAARGYLPWYAPMPADSLVRLEPLHAGLLRDVSLVIDPAGDDADFPAGDAPPAAGRAFEISRALGDLLEGAGARATLTREPLESPSDLQRLRRSLRAAPAWYVGIECGPGAAAVLHDPSSVAGERLAKSLAAWLHRRLGGSFAVGAETRFMLRQTPCPAVIVHLPLAAGRDAERARLVAYALFVGLRGGIGTGELPRTVLAGEVSPPWTAALAELDGAAVLPVDANGRFRFEAVESGVHRLRLVGDGSAPAAVHVRAAADTVRVRFGRTGD